MTKVQDLMESRPTMVRPNATIAEAASMMKNAECGFLPVGENNKPVGIITDRDIVMRCIAEGKDPNRLLVSDCMTQDVCACSEKDSLEDAARKMNDNAVSRLVVQTMDGEICGVLTFGRIIRSNDNEDEIGNIVSCATGKAA